MADLFSTPPEPPSPPAVDPVREGEQQFAEQLARLPHAATVFGSVAFALIALNVGVFLIMALVFDAGWLDAKLAPYLRLGANNGAATTDGEWWRLLTSMFMHFGLVHLALNMWTLFNVSDLLERLAGRPLFLTIYLGSGLGGGFVSLWWNGDRVWSAGASGAVFGLYGALVGYALREKHALPRTVVGPLLKSALVFIGYNLFYGTVQSGIDNAAHVGGLVTGLMLGYVTALPMDLERRAALFRGRLLLGVGVIAAVIALGVAAAPTFDYRMSEKLALEAVLKEIGERERSVVDQLNQWVAEVKKRPAAVAEYAGWLEREFVPFYEGMARRLGKLPLDAGRGTARKREALRRFAELHAAAFRHLAVAVRTENDAELAEYKKQEGAAQAALKSIKP